MLTYPYYAYVSLLYRGVAKYTWKEFKLIILDITENNKEVLLTREQHYLDLFKPSLRDSPLYF